ncbi:helix-turn-helix domain-containing protein [Roseivirga sp.]|uniref:helix-turn-helix domain-containing protein n=1 Tax=Roseivirga sp. TaxID=1964215 RepID=UPI003B51EC45
MRSEYAKRVLARTSEDTHRFVDKYTDLIVLIKQVMKEKKMTQKSLAEQLGKKPSEINKWLSGKHNLTLKSICKLEVVLDTTLLLVPKKLLYAGEKKKKISHLTSTPKYDLNVGLDSLKYVKPKVSKAKENVEERRAA